MSSVMTAEITDLYSGPWVSLRRIRKPEQGINGYVYSHETRCQGLIVAVLPFRWDDQQQLQLLVKREVTPCWDLEPVRSAITGGWEGGHVTADAVREMLEETGYEITADELIPLGQTYASKSADTRYELFSVDLTGRVAGPALGDGSVLEAEATAEWIRPDEVAQVMDPQVSAMWVRLLRSSAGKDF